MKCLLCTSTFAFTFAGSHSMHFSLYLINSWNTHVSLIPHVRISLVGIQFLLISDIQYFSPFSPYTFVLSVVCAWCWHFSYYLWFSCCSVFYYEMKSCVNKFQIKSDECFLHLMRYHYLLCSVQCLGFVVYRVVNLTSDRCSWCHFRYDMMSFWYIIYQPFQLLVMWHMLDKKSGCTIIYFYAICDMHAQLWHDRTRLYISWVYFFNSF